MVSNDPPFLAGIMIAVIHVVSTPDHLAAITPLIIEVRKKPWKIGVSWGFGHTTGMLIIGVLLLLLKEAISIEHISYYGEQLVAFVLIGVGVWALVKEDAKKSLRTYIFKGKHEKPPEKKDEKEDISGYASRIWGRAGKSTLIFPYSIGCIHGLNGIAHFLLLLPTLGFATALDSIQYITGFTIGTMLTMSVYALILGKISFYLNHERHSSVLKGLRLISGVLAIVVGVYWLYPGGKP